MARKVNEQEYTAKRNEILDAAQQLVLTKGYERMTIQDLQAALKISSGAFYHYFGSKTAVLVALAERMQAEMEQAVQAIGQDPRLPADEKLRQFFATVMRRDITQTAKALLLGLLLVWFNDDNALLRHKVDEARVRRLAPLLAEIVRQGVGEGVCVTSDPVLAAEVVFSLIQGLQYALARRYAVYEQSRAAAAFVEAVAGAYDTHMAAIEQVLGAPAGLVPRTDVAAVKEAIGLEKELSSK
jgi:AcrR family transcriptional regulator